MAIKTRQTDGTGVTNENAPLTNEELDNNFIELVAEDATKADLSGADFTGQVTIDTSTENALDILADATNQTLLRLSHPTAPTDAGGYFAFNSDGTTDNNVLTFGVEYSSVDYDVLNIQRSTQNVGIGTVNPSEKLEVYGTTPRFQINDRGLYQAQLALIGNDLEIRGSSGQIEFYQGNADGALSTTQSMTLDASGNLLVATTDNTLYNNTSGSGLCYRANLSLDIARQSTAANQPMLILNETGVDGDIAQFRKDGASVGSIGTRNGYLHIRTEAGTNGSGIRFSDGYVMPCASDGSNSDATTDLGLSGSRFKDLYLSGTAYIGGNAALTTADEGSGNGLDADLLDGQHGSYYQVARTALGYVDVATGSYGTIKVDDDRGVTWAGYAIRDDWVFMSNGAERSGIYNDTNNEWAIQWYQNAQVQLYYNGGLVCKTTSGGLDLTVDTTDVLNFTANSTNSNRGISFNSRTALSASNTGDWLRLNNNSEFTVGTWSPKKIASGEQILGGTSDVTSGGQVAVSAGTNPYLSFHEGSTRRAYVQYLGANNALFIYNEEAGNLKFRGNAGTVNFDFETTGATNTGRLFVDADDFAMKHGNNDPIVYGRKDSHTWLYYNGDWRFRTEDNGIRVRSPSAYTYNQMIMETNGTVRGYVYANTSNSVGFLDSDGNWAVRVTRDTDVDFLVNGVEKFSIGTSSTTSANDITVNSDERIKDNVELIPNALEKVQAIRGVTFNRTDTDDDTRHAGVIAQEVEKVLPEVVTENEDTGIKSVAYANMVGLLIEAIKEQQTQIDDLKAEVTRLKGLE
jgi:hypothetical protein